MFDVLILHVSREGLIFILLWGILMGVIHCCGGLRPTKSYMLFPSDGFLEVRMDWLEACPVCSHTVLQLTRLDYKNCVSIIRKTNKKARILREKLESQIMSEIVKNTGFKIVSGGSFYLYYNEFGKKKKCFANLSQLQMGLSENKDLIQKKLLCV